MNMFRVIILFEGMEIGNASYIQALKETKKKWSLNFKNFKTSRGILLNKNSLITIKLVFKNILYREFELNLIEEIYLSNANEIKISFEGNLEDYIYNQDVIEIFHRWDNGEVLNWKGLNNKSKEAWLVACLYSSGLPTSLPEQKNFIVDCALIKSSTDFYCLLGEVFCGSKGYFGQDLDGLNDCMNGLDLRKINKSKVTFLNFTRLTEILNVRMTNYTNILIDLFEKHGFILELK